jgi:NAD+ kinase
MVNTVGLVLHPRRDTAPAIDTIVDWARRRSGTVLGLPDEVGRLVCDAIAVDQDQLAARADLLVSLGGDGTMLRTMRMSVGRATPVLGVNLGKLGFLAEIDTDELPAALSAIDANAYRVEPRMAVRARLPGGTEVTGFNDIVLVRSPGHRSAAVSISVQGHPFVRYAADAVIVATPTGSTAYSFSAGGPIVSPRLDAVLVVAAAAHSVFNRALMLAADEELSLELLPSSGRLAVEVDGEVAGQVEAGDTVTAMAVTGAASVVRLLAHATFYERARRKLQVNGSLEVE